VAFAGRHAEYGLAVVIDHGDEVKSLYGHLSDLRVAPGAAVRRGDLIALSGNTGRSSGPHLHYEIQVRGRPVDPRGFAWE
jgi:murein DD-endopeptidase MepM/ murein hydrolase activator NlpD